MPIPRVHVLALGFGGLLHVLRPWRVYRGTRTRRSAGWLLVATGAAVVGWAVRTAGAVDLSAPDSLVTSGPYAYSRNPMYVAWHAMFLGLSLLANAVWLILLFPAVLAVTHRAIRREEQHVERRFRGEYRDYAAAVRRYP